MGKYVGIKKYLEKNNMYYYVVSTNDFGGALFYIRIDPISKILDFFETSDFNQEVVYSKDMHDPDFMLEAKNSSINLHVTPYVLLKVYRAIKNNDFPEYLDYCA
ncbi:MAG TPA: hypothetical protein VGT41_03525 [Candidatus Babeliales bacterium]|nr:hypothetical protein [Candidatus Babeliales bacterium]